MERPAGGAGLTPRRHADPFPAWASTAAGATTVAAALLVGVTLYLMNPAFANGTAMGKADQLAAPVADAGGAALAPGSPEAEGRRLVGAKGCGACHVVPGLATAKGTVGPSLAGVGSRAKIAGGAVDVKSPDDLKKWVLNPAALKPGTAMPNVGLTEDEAAKVAAFLATLK